jgi:PBSX family phage portal protein
MAQAETTNTSEKPRRRPASPNEPSLWGVVKKSLSEVFITKKSKKVQKETSEAREPSKSLDEDPFAHNYDQYKAIVPPFNLYELAMMPEKCGEMTPSIDAMSVNIEKLGHRIIARPGVHGHNEEISQEIKGQIALIDNFFANSVIDQEQESFEELRSRARKDLETTGNAYIEVIPKVSQSTIPSGLKHIPSWTVRLRKLDEDYTPYEVPRAVKNPDGSWRMSIFPDSKQFRRFVQIRESGARAVYFKEWNDPRRIDATTGEVDESISDALQAHEIIHLKLYSPRSPYGLPRWIGRLFAIYGARAAEEINYITFENNQMPGLALLATNVAVTDGSLDRMKEFIEERIQGNKNYATILLIEAEPVGEGMKDPSSMKMDLKPLTDFQHTDAMFKEYITMNNEMIRRSFRLPPIFVGRAEDYNRAVAEASRKLAEEQIFLPERKAIDRMWTNTIIMRLGVSSVVFRSNKPNVTDNFELTQVLATAERSGGLTPRTSTRIVEDVLGDELPAPTADMKPDQPFTMTMMEHDYDLQAGLPGPGVSGPGTEKKYKGNGHADDSTEVALFLQNVLERDSTQKFLNDDERNLFMRIVAEG